MHLEAVGTAITERMSWDQGALDHEPLVQGPAAHLWTRTDLKPTDIDMAQLYDGFSFNCLSWIEALGFCGWGEAKDFLDGGTNIALDGMLPLNTHGGQLSSGRLHGYGFIHEAVTQLRGHAGERQVANAGDRGREQRRRRARRRVPLHQGTLIDREGTSMQRFYDDEGMNFAVLISLGFAYANITDVGETLATIERIPDGDSEAWVKEWTATARPARGSRPTSRSPAGTPSARAPGCCRASTYYDHASSMSPGTQGPVALHVAVGEAPRRAGTGRSRSSSARSSRCRSRTRAPRSRATSSRPRRRDRRPARP